MVETNISVGTLGSNRPSSAASAFEHYKSLVVFPKDVEVPEETILTYWLRLGTPSARNTRKILTDLDRKALFRLGYGQR